MVGTRVILCSNLSFYYCEINLRVIWDQIGIRVYNRFDEKKLRKVMCKL